MGKMEAVDDLVGTGADHGEGDCFDETASAHGAVHATGFSAQIVPVIGFYAYTPGAAAERPAPVMNEAVDVDFAAQAVEANGLVAGGFYVHSPTVDSSP
ncbi:hypothetical protein D3C79_769920 [compost metagenome]